MLLIIPGFASASRYAIDTTPSEEKISLSFTDTPIPVIFRFLGTKGVNFVYEDTPVASEGKTSTKLDDIRVTISLKDVTIKKAIMEICKSADISCQELENKHYQIQRYISYMIDMGVFFDSYNIDIKPGLSGTGGGSSTSGTTTSTSSAFSGASGDSFKMKEEMDTYLKDLKTLLTPEGRIIHTKRGQYYVIDRPSAVQRIKTVLEKEKKQNPSVKLSVKLVEIVLSDKLKYGLNWNAIVKKFTYTGGQPNVWTIGNTTTGNNISSGFSFSFGSENIDLLFKALGEYGDVKVVRNWTVNSRAGLPVVLSDIESIPYMTETAILTGTTQQTQTTTTSSANFIDVGIRITIVGNKVADNYEGQIYVMISSLVDIVNLRTGDNPFYVPDVKSSSVVVPLSVKFGETLILSGFKTNTKIQRSEGIPLLSKLPVIGGLFGYKNTDTSDSEFIILIEPEKVL